ncbi:MAG TPA: hypothetical protein VF990_03560 [Candidatus Dormibacteraeota bacterium]
MRTDSELRSEFRSALEAVTPPAPWLGQTVKKELGTKLSTRRADRARVQLRFGLNVVAILVLLAVAIAAVGVYLTLHQSVVPAHPGAGRVFFPTKMVTASTGWSWVGSSELWRTTDGGVNWTNVSPPSLPDRLVHYAGDLHGPAYYSDVAYLLDATHAWVAETGHSAAFGAGLYIATFRTTDGGKTWHEGASLGGVSPALYFLDENHGWLLLPTQSSLLLYTTDDGGVSWKPTTSVAETVPPPTGSPTIASPTIVFSSLTTGWLLSTDGSLLVTHDGGATWQVQPLPITPEAGGVSPPRFFDPQHGQIIAWASSASPAVLLVTSDGGSTWVVRSIPGEIQFGGNFIDASHGWVIAGSAADFDAVPGVPLPLYRTEDGGLTWVRIPTNVVWRSQDGHVGPIDILVFVDQNNGFAVREKYMANGSTQWLKTTDGGRTWTVVVEAP